MRHLVYSEAQDLSFLIDHLPGVEIGRVTFEGEIQERSERFEALFADREFNKQLHRVQVPFNSTSDLVFIFDKSQSHARSKIYEANCKLEEFVHLNLVRFNQQNTAHRKLKESQLFLDTIIQNIPNMIFVKDARDLKFVRLNRAGEEMIGIKSQDIVGKTDLDFFEEEQAKYFIKTDRDVIKGGQKVEIMEEPILTSEGIKYLQTTKIPISDQAGRPQYLLGISEDITKRREMEKNRLEVVLAQARQSEAEKNSSRLKFLAKASETLNESLDTKFMIEGFGRVCTEELFEICVVDLLDESLENVERQIITRSGKYYSARFRKGELNSGVDVEEGIWSVLKHAQSKQYPNVSPEMLDAVIESFEIKDEAEVLAERSLIIVPLIYYGSAFGAITLVAQSEKVKNGEINLSLCEDLARRASFALQNSRLFHQANQASRAKSSFLANISHEVRTPLGAILGFAELVNENGNLNEQQKDYMATIIRNGEQLLRIVDEILDLSKVESDKVTIERIEYSLPKLLDEIMCLFRVKALEKNLEFKFSCPNDLPERYLGDPLRIRQILINLISNAIKFTDEGMVGLSVRFKRGRESASEGHLIFTITDTGVGISPDQAQRLFQPFAQADESTTRIFGGTGLGLFLSKKMANLMGGDVTLEESSPQMGSRFCMSVKTDVVEQPSLDTDALTSKIPSDEIRSSSTSSMPDAHVLVVDDSKDNQILIKAFLNQSAVDVDLCGNGREGVETALKRNYDVVLMDIQMPEMDGFQAVRELRESGYKGIVVALTAHAMKGDREKCLESGFDDYICKPVSRRSLTECITRNLHH